MTDRPNVLHGEFEYDASDPPGYRGGVVNLRPATGASELSVKRYELPAGQSLCPYHYETVEEWLVLLEGELDLRTPGGTERLATGAIVCFPAGPQGAHKVTTPDAAAGPARFLMFSSARTPVVAVYPDSDKIGVWVGDDGSDRVLLRRRDGNVDYYDGELDGDSAAS